MVVIYLLISVILIILLTAKLKLHPFIALFLVALFYGLFAGMPLKEIVNSINQGFGDTLGKIGLLIVLRSYYRFFFGKLRRSICNGRKGT